MIKTPEELMPIWLYMQEKQTKAIIVGGFVRDALLNKTCYDIDVEVFNCNNLEFLIALLKPFGNVKAIGKAFGIVQLSYKSYTLDFSLPRADSKIGPKHQDFNISYIPNATFEQAASRRDFTINSLGFNPVSGNLLDPFNGLVDLKKKQLKAVSNAFDEDPLRVFRALQLAARLEFRLEKNTLKRCVSMDLKHVSKPRIQAEFAKLLLSPKPSFGLRYIKDIGIKKLFGVYVKDETKACDTLLLCCDAVAQSALHLDNKSKVLLQVTTCCVVLVTSLGFDELKNNQLTHKANLKLVLSVFLSSKKQQEACLVLFESVGFASSWFKTDCGLEERAKAGLYLYQLNLLDLFKQLINTLYPVLYPQDYVTILDNVHTSLDQLVFDKPDLLSGSELIGFGYKKGPVIKKIKDELLLKQCLGEVATKQEALEWLKCNKFKFN